MEFPIMKQFALAAALLAFAANGALACSQSEFSEKVQTFSSKLTALAQKNPQKAQEISQKVQKEAPQAKGLDDTCKKYDEWIAAVNKAS
jgi:hypothetical protein